MHTHQVVGILLAAGRGRRFDPSGERNKLIQRLPDGLPVVTQAAQNLCQVLSRVIVVDHDPLVAEQVNLPGCQSLYFSEADQGMGATLAFAISAVENAYPDANSVIVALGDMPFVQIDSIRQVVSAMRSGAQIARPAFQGQGGHPVGFAQCHFAALMALRGDVGARQLLTEYPVTRFEVQDSGVVQDIDFLADLKKI
jgi:molybdenum cofactor cytidylyltransferase